MRATWNTHKTETKKRFLDFTLKFNNLTDKISGLSFADRSKEGMTYSKYGTKSAPACQDIKRNLSVHEWANITCQIQEEKENKNKEENWIHETGKEEEGEEREEGEEEEEEEEEEEDDDEEEEEEEEQQQQQQQTTTTTTTRAVSEISTQSLTDASPRLLHISDVRIFCRHFVLCLLENSHDFVGILHKLTKMLGTIDETIGAHLWTHGNVENNLCSVYLCTHLCIIGRACEDTISLPTATPMSPTHSMAFARKPRYCSTLAFSKICLSWGMKILHGFVCIKRPKYEQR
jgi:hypothetical protein